MAPPRRIAGLLVRGVLYAVAVLVLALGGLIAAVETTWGKSALRAVIVREANQRLTATLEIGQIEGSLFHGLTLRGVRLIRDASPLVDIQEIALEYDIRELIEGGTLIRSLTLVRPQIVVAKEPDGRWNLATLVRSTGAPRTPGSPRRSIRIASVVVHDGSVLFRTPLTFGAAHVPTSFSHLDTTLSVASDSAGWRLDFVSAAFQGSDPALSITHLSGGVGNGDTGWDFRRLLVVTPRSEFTLGGQISHESPTRLNLRVDANHLAFQEWAGVLHGLSNIAVVARFDATLKGPVNRLDTVVNLRSDGGDVQASVLLNSTVPGWHGAGRATVSRLNLARWLNREDRASDITGAATFDLDLDLGGHFPRGPFDFRGSHAAYIGYEASAVHARGTLTATTVQLQSVDATAYGASVSLFDSSLALDAPFAFRFVGHADDLDLRRVPQNAPVPHVESVLALEFDVDGQFVDPFIRGNARFDDSIFLGARVAGGAAGSIDTSTEPYRYTGDGVVEDIGLHRFGEALDVTWLCDPRYDGTVAGRFHVAGAGGDPATMTLSGGGHLSSATLFGGRLSSAEVSIDIADGTVRGSYDGELFQIDPSIAMADPMYTARLTGVGQGTMEVRDLMRRAARLTDYSVDATLALTTSAVRGLTLDEGRAAATLDDGTLTFATLDAQGPAGTLHASGPLELDGVRESQVEYRIERGDLAVLAPLVGMSAAGQVTSAGRLSGPLGITHLTGEATIDRLIASGITAETTSARYDVTMPSEDPERSSGTLTGEVSGIAVSGQALEKIDGTVRYDAGHVATDLRIVRREGVGGTVSGEFQLNQDRTGAAVETLSVSVARSEWQLAAGVNPRVAWSDAGLSVSDLMLVDRASGTQRVAVEGDWRNGGGGRLTVTAQRVSVDALNEDPAGPSRYGGTLDGVAVVSGTREHPSVSTDFAITAGRVRRLSYERFGGRVALAGDQIVVDVRLDQSAGVWMTAAGTVPLATFTSGYESGPMHLAVASSQIPLGMLEGVTSTIRDVAGTLFVDVLVEGTSQDPHFTGRVDIAGAQFVVTSTGAQYRNGRTALRLDTDRIAVQAFHLEDTAGHALTISGTLGTHELRVGDLQVDVSAREFEVLRNQFGRMAIDASLALRGRVEAPRVTGAMTVTGGSLAVDNLLDRLLFQPYSTSETALPATDAFAALNPWDRLGFDVELHVPDTLRLIGDNVQVTPGTPLGLGNINLRVAGDLSLYKDPQQPMYVNGSFDSVTGTYAFQGRRFDVDPTSSINFRGDFYPEVYVTVNRVISGVETRVSIIGPVRQPELRLASTPPLDQSDILSLIVFNTSVNELTALQQQQLAVRAGTLAAGFIAAPMMTALERSIGIDTLEIEPGADIRGGPRVTVGDEIAPGLVARFSRQFGEGQYDEATLEYYLSRILRIRASFSDAGSLTARSPFRRVERAGIDLLLFFSF